MDIIFHCDELNERGTAIACYDYALYNETLLGNNSIIIYDQNLNNNIKILKKFKSKFKVLPYDQFETIDKAISSNFDLMYVLKGGNVDQFCSKYIPTMVHAVFPQSIFQIHGSSYAFVSDWLSKKSSYLIPSVPHIVNYPKLNNKDNLRNILGISQEATVFASYGGKNSFDLEFVKNNVIPRILKERNNIYFLFMNYEKFIEHPRAIFLPINIDKNFKERFIASADAMLHARSLGESFGLAIAEFSSKNKPIISYRFTKDKNHEFVLSSSIILYNNSSDLYRIISRFNKNDYVDINFKAYLEKYNPESVMNLFDKHLIFPASKNKKVKIILNNITLQKRIIINKFFKVISNLYLPLKKAKNIFIKLYSQF